MMITQVTLVGFKIPEEYKQLQQFQLNTDLSTWKEHITSNYITYKYCHHDIISNVTNSNYFNLT